MTSAPYGKLGHSRYAIRMIWHVHAKVTVGFAHRVTCTREGDSFGLVPRR
jgi:hypothetical protein